ARDFTSHSGLFFMSSVFTLLALIIRFALGERVSVFEWYFAQVFIWLVALASVVFLACKRARLLVDERRWKPFPESKMALDITERIEEIGR
ncbi:MAG: hypothetical protein AAB840_02090, partial [Patescibacteria group bacterium]